MDRHDLVTAVASFALPPGFIFLLIIAACLVGALGRRGLSRTLWLISTLLLWIVCMPVLGHALMGMHLSGLEPLGAAQAARIPPGRSAVVVLGMGAVSPGREYGGQPQLIEEAQERLRYGAWLARSHGLPLLYSGGAGLSGLAAPGAPDAEARVAARAAQAQWGQPVRWIEAQGYAVRDSARYSAALLRADRIDSVVLVAHAWKMPRAIAEYQAAGLRVIPAPMAFPSPVALTLADWMPTSEGLRWVRNVLRERFGLWSSVLRSGT